MDVSKGVCKYMYNCSLFVEWCIKINDWDSTY